MAHGVKLPGVSVSGRLGRGEALRRRSNCDRVRAPLGSTASMRAVLGLSFLLVGVALFASPGCGNECDTVGDCSPSEVCLQGVCTPFSSSYLACARDSDCGDAGPLVCLGGRCSLPMTVDTGVMQQPDAGRPDTGLVDAGRRD